MSTHNIIFLWANKKNTKISWLKNIVLSRAKDFIYKYYSINMMSRIISFFDLDQPKMF